MATTRKKIGPDHYEVHSADMSSPFGKPVKLGDVRRQQQGPSSERWVGTAPNGSWVSTHKIFREVALALESDWLRRDTDAAMQAKMEATGLVKDPSGGPVLVTPEQAAERQAALAAALEAAELLDPDAAIEHKAAAVEAEYREENCADEPVLSFSDLEEEAGAAAVELRDFLASKGVGTAEADAPKVVPLATHRDVVVEPVEEDEMPRAAARTEMPGVSVEYAVQRGTRVEGTLDYLWITIRSSRTTSPEHAQKEAERMADKLRVRIVTREVRVTEWQKVDY